SRDHWKPALLDFRDGGSRQPCAGPHHDKTSGPPEGKSLVARTVGKTFVAFSQLQCSRKPSRAAVRNSMINYSKKPCSTALLRLRAKTRVGANGGGLCGYSGPCLPEKMRRHAGHSRAGHSRHA